MDIEDNNITELDNLNKNKHKKYNIDFKLKVINLYHINNSIHLLSNKLGIDRKVIRDWINKEQELKSLTHKKNKYRGKKIKVLLEIFQIMKKL